MRCSVWELVGSVSGQAEAAVLLEREEAEGGEFWEHFALETRAVATFLQDGQSPLPSSRSATIPRKSLFSV